MKFLLFSIIFLISLAFSFAFLPNFSSSIFKPKSNFLNAKKLFSKVESAETLIRPSINDNARTIAYICTSGTLTSLYNPSSNNNLNNIQPFSSIIQYILDENGWPVLLLNKNNIHAKLNTASPSVSLYCQMPKIFSPSYAGHIDQVNDGVRGVTIIGELHKLIDESANDSSSSDESDAFSNLKLNFGLIHPALSKMLNNNKDYQLFRIKPQHIYLDDGSQETTSSSSSSQFSSLESSYPFSTWVDITQYQNARPDVVANQLPRLLPRFNSERQKELHLISKHFLGIPPEKLNEIKMITIDRLGLDIRVNWNLENPETSTTSNIIEEFRIGFRHPVLSLEDAKSELMKLFQETWEREMGRIKYEEPPALVPRSKI